MESFKEPLSSRPTTSQTTLIEELERCFCLEEEDGGSSSHYFSFGCGNHKLHRNCLREMLRFNWSQTKMKTVDFEGRRVVTFPCPLCRKNMPPERVRALQVQRRVLKIDLEVLEENVDVQYSVYIQNIFGDKVNTLTESFFVRDLPADAAAAVNGSIGFAQRRLYADFEIQTTSPQQIFEVTIQKNKSVSYYMVKQYRVLAKDLEIIEKDAKFEYEQQQLIDDLQCKGRLHILSGVQQEREQLQTTELIDLHAYEMPPSSSPPSPPLPSLQELFNSMSSSVTVQRVVDSTSTTTAISTTTTNNSSNNNNITTVISRVPSPSLQSVQPFCRPPPLPPRRKNGNVVGRVTPSRRVYRPMTSSSKMNWQELQRHSPVAAATTTTTTTTKAGPSRIKPTSPYWSVSTPSTNSVDRKKSRKFTEEERFERKKRLLKKKEEYSLSKIMSKINTMHKMVVSLMGNVREWEELRETFETSSVESERRNLDPAYVMSKIVLIGGTVNLLSAVIDGTNE